MVGVMAMRSTGFRLASVAAVVVASSAMVLAAPGVAQQSGSAVSDVEIVYWDHGVDPPRAGKPKVALAYWTDVLKTSRAVVRRDGQRWVRIGVTSRRDFPVPLRAIPNKDYAVKITVSVDTRGDGAPDGWYEFETGRVYKSCWVYRRVAKASCRFWAADNGALNLSAPARFLGVRKHIRWSVSTGILVRHGESIFGVDRAPDRGQYS